MHMIFPTMKFYLLMVIFTMLNILQCNAWPKVGEIANSSSECRATQPNTACTEEYAPVCAKQPDNTYLQGSNICDFCRQHGRTNSLILQIGLIEGREFSCKELEVGDYIHQDPECVFLYGKLGCTKEYNPHCATTGNYRNYLQGDNKCMFCSKNGNSSYALIVNIGATASETGKCSPFYIGSKATDDLACRYLAGRKEKICTEEYSPVCGQHPDNTIVKESNKCYFCSRYGNTCVIVTECSPNETTPGPQ